MVFGLALLAAWLGEAERRVRFGVTDSTARRLLLLVAVISLAASGCQGSVMREAEMMTGGNVARGHAAIVKYGCGACHTIPRVTGANTTVGPPLQRIARRTYLGGHLTNTPANLTRWIQHPQGIDPKNAMPDLAVGDQEAKDIAAPLHASIAQGEPPTRTRMAPFDQRGSSVSNHCKVAPMPVHHSNASATYG
jgi:cytochrome c2